METYAALPLDARQRETPFTNGTSTPRRVLIAGSVAGYLYFLPRILHISAPVRFRSLGCTRSEGTD
jgi:hypothetical protein